MSKNIVTVVGVLNAARTIRRCLDSLVAQPCDVVVVDGGSTDGTVEIVREYQVGLISKLGNLAVARNEGIRRATHEYVAFTDGDTIVTNHWLKELLKGFAPGVKGVGGPTELPSNTLLEQTLACIPVHGPSLEEVPLFGPSKHLKPFTSDRDVYAAIGRNSIYKRAVLEEVGLFNERVKWAEDIELNQRVLDAGYRLAYRPAAKVRHDHPENLRGFFSHQMRYAIGQAIASRVNPRTRRKRHLIPLVAFSLALVLAVLGSCWHFLYPMAALLVGVVGMLLAYGVKCARWKRDWRLAFTVPLCAALWQFAWVFGYPWGLIMVYGKSGR